MACCYTCKMDSECPIGDVYYIWRNIVVRIYVGCGPISLYEMKCSESSQLPYLFVLELDCSSNINLHIFCITCLVFIEAFGYFGRRRHLIWILTSCHYVGSDNICLILDFVGLGPNPLQFLQNNILASTACSIINHYSLD